MGLTPTVTPAGTYWPATRLPPFGTIRGRVDGAGGYMRRPSSRTALRYLEEARAWRVRSSWVWKAVLNSIARFWTTVGALRRWYVKPLRRDAVLIVLVRLFKSMRWRD